MRRWTMPENWTCQRASLKWAFSVKFSILIFSFYFYFLFLLIFYTEIQPQVKHSDCRFSILDLVCKSIMKKKDKYGQPCNHWVLSASFSAKSECDLKYRFKESYYQKKGFWSITVNKQSIDILARRTRGTVNCGCDISRGCGGLLHSKWHNAKEEYYWLILGSCWEKSKEVTN